MKLTQKQEGFTQDYFNEVPPGKAYMTHYKVKSMAVADVCASKLLRTAKIANRLQELRQKTEDASIATVMERKQILTEIARGNLLDYQETGADGGYLSIGKESPNTRAISEITSRTEYDKDNAGAALVTKIKLHSPTQAIDLMNKMEKIYAEGTTINVDNRKVEINVDTDPKKKLISILNRLASRAEETESNTEPE